MPLSLYRYDGPVPTVVTYRSIDTERFGAVIFDDGRVFLGRPASGTARIVFDEFTTNPFKTVGKASALDGKLFLEPSLKPFCAVWLDTTLPSNARTGVEVVFTSSASSVGVFYATQGGPAVLFRAGPTDYGYAAAEFSVAAGVTSLIGAQKSGARTGRTFELEKKFSVLVEVFDGAVRVFNGENLVALFVGDGLNTSERFGGRCFGFFAYGKVVLESFRLHSYGSEPSASLTKEYVNLEDPRSFYESSFVPVTLKERKRLSDGYQALVVAKDFKVLLDAYDVSAFGKNAKAFRDFYDGIVLAKKAESLKESFDVLVVGKERSAFSDRYDVLFSRERRESLSDAYDVVARVVERASVLDRYDATVLNVVPIFPKDGQAIETDKLFTRVEFAFEAEGAREVVVLLDARPTTSPALLLPGRYSWSVLARNGQFQKRSKEAVFRVVGVESVSSENGLPVREKVLDPSGTAQRDFFLVSNLDRFGKVEWKSEGKRVVYVGRPAKQHPLKAPLFRRKVGSFAGLEAKTALPFAVELAVPESKKVGIGFCVVRGGVRAILCEGGRIFLASVRDDGEIELLGEASGFGSCLLVEVFKEGVRVFLDGRLSALFVAPDLVTDPLAVVFSEGDLPEEPRLFELERPSFEHTVRYVLSEGQAVPEDPQKILARLLRPADGETIVTQSVPAKVKFLFEAPFPARLCCVGPVSFEVDLPVGATSWEAELSPGSYRWYVSGAASSSVWGFSVVLQETQGNLKKPNGVVYEARFGLGRPSEELSFFESVGKETVFVEFKEGGT